MFNTDGILYYLKMKTPSSIKKQTIKRNSPVEKVTAPRQIKEKEKTANLTNKKAGRKT